MFISRKTTPEEQQYHSYELETLCVIWAMERLRVYLIGQPFVVITDCSALRSTFSKKHMNPRVGRWWMKSLEFHFEIRHRPGRQMTHVDALSRNPVAPAQEIDCVKSINCLMNTLEEDDWLCILQKEDPKLRLMMENIEKQEKSSEDKREKYNEYEIKDGRLFKKEDGKLLWVVPRKARCQIARKYHNELGHPGFEKTYKKMREMFYFPRMRNYMKGFIGACIECLYNKVPGGKPQGKLHSIDKIGAPLENFCKERHIDHVLTTPSTARANGQVERLNRYITPSLASLCKKEDHSDWDQQVNTVQWGINNTHHQATKTTPFRLLFNYEPRDIHGDCIQKILLEHQQEEDIENRRQEALEKIKEDQERQKRRYNAKRSKASVYEPGDLVMIRREASSTGESRKLMEKYKGPYIVTEKLPFDRYRIEDMPETQRTQKFYKSVVAVDCMKRFMAPQSEDDSDEEPEKPVEEKGTRKKTIEKEEKRTKKRPQYLSDYVTTFGDES
nr:unnamed protein product [Callosobruchus analis]